MLNRLVLALALVLFGFPAEAAITFVQHSTGSGNFTATTTAANYTGATELIACANTVNTATLSISDTSSNTWVEHDLIVPGTGGLNLRVFTAENVVTSSSQTITISAAGAVIGTVNVIGLAGTGTGAYEGLSAAEGNSPVTIPIYTPTNAGDAIITCGGNSYTDGTTTITISGATVTITDNIPGQAGTFFGATAGYTIQTTATAISPVLNYTASSAYMPAGLVAIKAGSAPPTGGTTLRSLTGVGK